MNDQTSPAAAAPGAPAAPKVEDGAQRSARPTSFRELGLQIANTVWQDAHVNVSGAVFFIVLAYGIIRPEFKDQCNQICALAGTYLFGAAKNK